MVGASVSGTVESVMQVLASGVVHVGPREADWLVEEASRRAPSGEGAEAIALALAARRAAGEPLQYVLGSAAFRHLELAVGPGVLVPRPETEVLVEIALERLEGESCLVDVGTGSGAIALAVKQERPDAQVWATDDSAEALRYARVNQAKLGLDVAILQGELLDPLPRALRADVDVVVSNPPYVAESERHLVAADVVAHEPHRALFAGSDGLAILRRLAVESPTWLRPGGWLVCEVGHNQAKAVTKLFETSGYVEITVHEDLAGRARIVAGRKQVG